MKGENGTPVTPDWVAPCIILNFLEARMRRLEQEPIGEHITLGDN